MSFIKKNFFKIFLITFIVFLPIIFIYADGSPSDKCPDGTTSVDKICNPLKNVNTINGLIKNILEGVIKIAIPVIALAIIYSGFLFVSARGAPEKLDKAKSALLYTLIGSAVLLGSWAIAQLISETVLSL